MAENQGVCKAYIVYCGGESRPLYRYTLRSMENQNHSASVCGIVVENPD